MLFHVRMDVNIPLDLDSDTKADIVSKEKAYSQGLQRDGRWVHLWRIVGEYSNLSIFDVESNDALHELLSGLPLFPYMDIHVTPLAYIPRPSSARRPDNSSGGEPARPGLPRDGRGYHVTAGVTA